MTHKNDPKPREPRAPRAPRAPARYAYERIERIIHEKARLSIMASLASHGEGLIFNDLKDLCALTDGNLSRHLQVLEEAGLVEVWKGFRNKRPQTLCRLTDTGRQRFAEYIAALEQVVADAAGAREDSPRPAGPFRKISPA